MRKQMRYENWVEVAPAPVIFPQKASNAPNLETIAEEGLEKMDAASNKISPDEDRGITLNDKAKMGLAVVVLPLTKLGGAALLLMVSLLWPFAVKFGFSYGPLREICWDMADALRL
ncbi:hypothetical protein SASPL_152272 [Salvia splendens]|uniref:Uncharacterized protein n=1 Tax=Salvia splendens TaxID=180675 RepID=A0A8X8Z0Q8_SALSN|nr:hypothetical protein SASPL_152272 [Salvia splendens]